LTLIQFAVVISATISQISQENVTGPEQMELLHQICIYG